jgi:uncharacterized membrane protein YfcA
MFLNTVIFQISVVIFTATLFRSAFGFGESLIGVPLLALWIPLNIAVPLSVLVSITIAAFVVVQDRKKIHIQSAGRLILYSIIGIPLGLLLLININDHLVKAILGAVIIIFSIYLLSGKQLQQLDKDSQPWLFGCGLISGILGGAYGLNGPPLVIYGTKRRWSAQHFRATLQGYFLVASFVGMIGYWISGLLSAAVFHYYLISLPSLIPAIFLGRVINHRLHGDYFFKYVYVILLGIGIFLMINALKGSL